MEELLETGRVNRVGTASLSVLRRGASTHSCSIKAPCLELWGGSPSTPSSPEGPREMALALRVFSLLGSACLVSANIFGEF